jgi:hypothetical protein
VSDWGRRDSPGERIEIELTPVEPRHEKSRVIVPPTDNQHSGADDAGEDRTDDHVPRRTLIVTAVAVGVAALGIGWVVGRGDDDATAEQTPTPTTVVVATTERIADTIAPPVTTARPRRSTTTTTTLPAGTPGFVALPPELRALPFEVAFADNERLYWIDLGSATIRTYPNGEEYSTIAFGPTLRELLSFASWNAASLRVIDIERGTDLRGSPEGLRASDQLILDGEGDLWVVSDDDVATAIGADQDGRTIVLPAGSFSRGGIFGDPAGGLLVYASGDIFDIDADNTMRLTTGEVVAIGANSAIVNDCDPQMVCDYVVIDRTTGNRIPIPLRQIVDDAFPPNDRLGVGRRTVIENAGLWSQPPSIVGDTALIRIAAVGGADWFGGGIAVVDLAEQRLTGFIPDAYNGATVSEDGSWVFAVTDGSGLVALEVATGEIYPFGPASADYFYSVIVRTRWLWYE